MTLQQVPLTNSPNQRLTVPLNIDGVVKDYFFTLRYNEIAGYWALRVENQNRIVLIDSVPLVTGLAPAGNLLAQFAYKGIGSMYIINASGVSKDYPNAVSLGSDFYLIWGDTPAA